MAGRDSDDWWPDVDDNKSDKWSQWWLQSPWWRESNWDSKQWWRDETDPEADEDGEWGVVVEGKISGGKGGGSGDRSKKGGGKSGGGKRGLDRGKGGGGGGQSSGNSGSEPPHKRSRWKLDDADESATGPQAQDPKYKPPPRMDRIPKPLDEDMLTQAEAGQENFSGGKAVVCETIPCDVCKKRYAVASAFVRCDKYGAVANNYGAGAKIGRAKEDIAAVTADVAKKCRVSDDAAGSSNEDSDSTAATSTYLVQADTQHVCFRCYGKLYKTG